jgi:lysophospholipase L1-like esterase
MLDSWCVARLTQRAARWSLYWTASVATVGFVACGDGGPGEIVPSPPGVAVSGVVFYDENANGLRDATEIVPLAGVIVSLGSGQGTSDAQGRFTAIAPQGSQTVVVRQETLPSYFAPGIRGPVQVPATADIAVPLTLPIGSNHSNLYLGFGDSITAGEGGSTPAGYLDYLAEKLRSTWGKASFVEDGWSGTKSDVGANRMADTLADVRPAFTLILYGTNDWNKAECKVAGPACPTVENLRSMIKTARGFQSMPILGTIPPVNPLFVDRGATERNQWVSDTNKLVRDMARQERVPLADVHALFLQQSSLASLFPANDDKHPNDSGYRLISQAFFKAITEPLAVTTAAAVDTIGVLEP